MSEIYEDNPILTLDSDFQIYRKHRNQTIPVINLRILGIRATDREILIRKSL